MPDPVLDPDLGAAVGGEIRRLREAAGLTTRELAARAAMSQPFLSQIERGASVPSMASVYRLAQALGVRPGDLLPAVLPSEVTVVRRGEGRPIPVAEHPAAAVGRALLLRSTSALEIVEYEFGPDEYIAEWFESPGESALYVVAGRLEVDILGAGTYRIAPGDLIHFPAGTRDRWRLLGETPARVLFTASVPGTR
ncbi:helix-turn-helix domain-containing protein [Microbacterium sp. 18062]|uniref:helix-turn-helix domain-containing protein n=1 Tax=Microbacterium sp. 18062 TaxID=2681410 RepID=UPI00190F4EFC|nr:XRE family transcriptional regulator [Microbacterium sp. 18062]